MPSDIQLIDTHCHLQFDAYLNREDEVIAAAARAGVTKLICVGTSLADSHKSVDIARKRHNVWVSVGAHPHEASQFLADPNAAKKLEVLAKQTKVVAIGETGLDYYRNLSPKDTQLEALRVHIKIANKLDVPIILHVRDAWRDFWPVYDELKPKRGVIHSFSAGPKQLAEVLSRDLLVGLNGIMTFTSDETQLAAAKLVPLDRLVLETDAPFLTPAPNRHELCEPKHTRLTAEFLAKLRGESLDRLAAATTNNATKLFDLSA